MARITTLDGVDKDLRKNLARTFQSGHINFLLGSGASLPAIPAAGNIESAIADLFDAGNDVEARARMYGFLKSVQLPTNALIADAENENNTRTLNAYGDCLATIETILSERRTTLLPKQATIFTTNYDLFIEKAALRHTALKLNDGFSRIPSLDNRMEFSSRNFFNTIYNTGNLYSYKVEIPCVNLIKLHGSLSWKKEREEIIFRVATKDALAEGSTPDEINEFIDGYSVVLPQATKFRTTLLERTYYELLRIYANELDRENAGLVAFGFSFGDEHIRDITRRALKNPTLRLTVFSYGENDRDSFSAIFDGFNNVEIIAPPAGENIDFGRFNEILRGSTPRTGSKT